MNLLLKIRKEPVMTAMVVRMIILIAGTYGLSLSEEQLTPIIVGGWTLFEIIAAFAARSQVVPNVKLEGRTTIPVDVKDKLNN